MKGLLKILVWLVGITLVAIIAAIIIIPQVFDPNEYKGQITDIVRDKTGRDLNIEGDLELSVFPSLAVTTGRLTLANPEQFGNVPMAEIDGVDINVSLMPLLSKKVEAGEIKLRNPVIRLITLEDGTNNWQDLASAGDDSATTPGADEAGSGENTALAALAIQGINLESGSVIWDDRSAPAKYTVTGLNLKTGAIIPGRAIPIDIAADVTGDALPEPLNIRGTVEATADTSLESIALAALDVTVTGQTINTTLKAPDVAVDLVNSRITASTIDATAKLGENDLALNLPGLDFDMNAGTLATAGLSAAAKAGEASANLAAQSLGFDLNTSQVSLGAVSGDAVSGDMSARLSVPELKAGISDSVFKIRNIGVDAKINDLIARIDVPDVSVDTTTMALAARGVKLVAEGLEINADVNARDLDSNPTFDGQVVLAGADLRAAAKKAAGFEATDPNALSNVSLNLNFSGSPTLVNVKSLEGRIDDMPLAGTATIDLDQSNYQFKLAGGTLVLDRYLPKAGSAADSGATPAASADPAAAAAAAPVALGSLNVDADIRLQRLEMQSAGITVDDLALVSRAQSGNSMVPTSLSGRISGASLPEPVVLDASLMVDIANPEALRLVDLKVTANGETLKAGISVPVVQMPGKGPVNLTDVSANFDYQDIGASLYIPNFTADLDQNALTITNITGSGRYTGISSDLSIGKLTGNLATSAFAINALKADIKGERPLGVVSGDSIKLDLTAENVFTEGLNFVGDAGRIDLDINATEIIKAPRLDGSIRTKALNVRTLLDTLAIDYTPASAQALTSVDLDASISGGLDAFKLAPMSINLDGTPISGFLDVTQKPSASYSYDLNIGNLNLDNYVPAATGQATPAPEATNAAAAVAAPAALIKDLNVNGSLKIASLISGGMEISNIEIGTRSEAGVVTMEPIRANLYGGAAEGRIVVDARNEAMPTVNVDQSLTGLKLGPAMAAAGVSEKLEGTGNLVAKLTASGLDDKAIRESLNGTVKFDLRDGAVKGFDLQKILSVAMRLYEVKRGREPVDSQAADETRFSSMSGTLVMAGGNATNDDLNMKAPGLRITGNGGASMVNQTIDYNLIVAVVESVAGQGGEDLTKLKNETLPIKVDGTFDDPKFRPDLASIFKQRLESKAKNKLQEKLNKKLGLPEQGTSDSGEPQQRKSSKDILQGVLQQKLDQKYGSDAGTPAPETSTANQPEPVTQPAPAPEPQAPPPDPEDQLKDELKKKLLKKLFN